MMYVLIGWDAPDSKEKRPKTRAAHLEYWRPWDETGKIIVAGPMTDLAGSLFIVETESEQEARQKIENDPYVQDGVFERTEIHPFKGVLPSIVYGS